MQGLTDETLQNILHQEVLEDDNTEAAATLIEAVRRIEEANLWKTLMTASVFEVGSARPEILHSVNAQIRDFARKKLEECVGISRSTPSHDSIHNVFDAEEVQALKILAAKLLKKDFVITSDYKPTLRNVAAESTQPVAVRQASAAVQGASTSTVNKVTPSKQERGAPKRSKNKKEDLGPHYVPQPEDGYVAPQVHNPMPIMNQSGDAVSAGGVSLESLIRQNVQNS